MYLRITLITFLFSYMVHAMMDVTVYFENNMLISKMGGREIGRLVGEGGSMKLEPHIAFGFSRIKVNNLKVVKGKLIRCNIVEGKVSVGFGFTGNTYGPGYSYRA